jgi:selenocysteine lyase/cysteine desulfurase
MGMFDKLKEATSGLVDDAKAKVTDMTGVDADKLIDAGNSFTDASDNVSEGFNSLQEGRVHG